MKQVWRTKKRVNERSNPGKRKVARRLHPTCARRVIKTSSFGIDPQGRSTFIHTALSIDFRLVGPPNDYLIFHQFISAIGVRVRISHYRQFISIFANSLFPAGSVLFSSRLSPPDASAFHGCGSPSSGGGGAVPCSFLLPLRNYT